DYVEMTPAEYDAAEEQTRLEHQTNDELADAFLGRQVRVEHSATVTSVYAHLSDIAPAIVPGRTVFMRATLGEVGVSGTSAGAYDTNDGVHLHFEIWVDGRYLGEGLSIDETMRIYAALFAGRNGE
ncbi:MAG: M23 family metallopeptidase, partial [Caldilineaceae bacterium]|nr:M23 family metallopeptidase [Caldilineaceae bacterium]